MIGVGAEAQLLAAAARGDAASWDALVEIILPELWATALSFGLDEGDAADACRAVCVRLAQSLHELATGNALAWWLARAGREECRRAAAQAAHRCAPVVDLHAAAKRRAALMTRLAAGT